MLDLYNFKDEDFSKAEKIYQELKYLKNNIINEQVNFRGKCGEIFLENGKYLITCYFCTKTAISIDILIEHIYHEHLILKAPEYLEPLYNEEISNIEISNVQNNYTKKEQVTSTINNNRKIKEEPFLMDSNQNTICSTTNLDDLVSVDDIDEIPTIPYKVLNKFGQYSCSYCTKTYKEFNELKEHFVLHTTTTQKEELLQKNENYIEHIKNTRNPAVLLPPRLVDNKYCCKLCNRQYAFEKSYRAHFKKNHTENLSQHYFKTYRCPDCTSSFKTRDRFEAHRNWHKRDKPHKCEYCPRVFLLKANLTSHVHTHLGIKPYSCRFCGRRFTQQNSQKAHERNIHTKERPHQCEQCGKSFPRSTLLREHLKRHTNTRPFKCHICMKAFYNNHYLQAHINRHTGNKTYDCHLCPKKFRDSNTLKAHKKLHQDTKDYKCKLCNREFAQKPGLYGHMKLFHKSVTAAESKIDDTKELES